MNKKKSVVDSTSFQPYPLYDLLVAKARERNECNMNVDYICKTINDLALLPLTEAQEHYDELHALLLHHDLITNKGILLSLIPNEGKTLASNKSSTAIKYIFNKIPNSFRPILNEYIIHYSN